MCTHRSWFAWRAALVCFVLAAGVLGVRSSAHDRVSQVTWTTDVEPILRTRCVGCHTNGGFGPMPLDTYEDARRWARAIREEVLERRMPPWPAAKGFGAFSNDRSLTPIEIELLTAWADGATPLGPPVASPQADPDHRQPSRAPDLLVSVPAAHEVGPLTERIEVPTTLTSDRWIAGWEFQPGNRSILERAEVFLAPGIPIGTWTAPDGVVIYAPGVAQRLPAGSRLILELHYRKSSTPQTDRSGVAFYFGERPRQEVYHRQLPCGVTTVDREMDVLAVAPRADGGESVEIVARHADGRVEPLVVVPRYAPAYPSTYRFQHVTRLRHDSAIDVRSTAPTCGAELDFIAPVAAR
jgi:hypothetical protein